MTLWMPKKRPLYAPMLSSFGGGSARGFGKGLGGGGGDLTTSHDPLGDNSGRALYTFDNHANDASGSYNGTAYSANFSSASKKLGTHSLDVTGGGYVLANGLIQPEIDPWTAMWWWRKSNNSNLSVNNRMVDFKENSSSQGTTVVWEGDNSWHFVLRYNQTGANSSKYIGSGSGLNNGNWHHICVGASGTYGSQQAFVYVNGQNVNSNTSFNRSDSSEANGILIGTGYGGDSNGFFDNFRLFNRALTASEIATIWAAEAV